MAWAEKLCETEGHFNSIQVMKEKVRHMTGRNGDRSVQKVVEDLRAYQLGWKNSLALAETPGIFRALDEWIRHRLRQLHLKQWKTGKTIYWELLARRTPDWVAQLIAANTRRRVESLLQEPEPRSAEPIFRRLGTSQVGEVALSHRTAVCGPARMVVCQGNAGETPAPL